jgi:hypothetical protein
MTELDDQDAKSLILDAGDDSDIAYAKRRSTSQLETVQAGPADLWQLLGLVLFWRIPLASG